MNDAKSSADIERLLREALAENKIEVSPKTRERLGEYLILLARWNRIYNLTTITRPRDMVYLHIIDSLVVKPYLQGKYYLDVGSGAGLPGIPLAITSYENNQDRAWTLLDKTGKKTRFLSHVIGELQLSNVEVVQERCEEFKPDLSFDTILARAFSSLTTFANLGSRLLSENGTLIAMKGKYPQAELQALPNCYQAETQRLVIKGIDVERHIVQIKIRDSVTNA